MFLKNPGLKTLLHSRPFLLLLYSQGISNIGDSFRLVAVTMLLYKLTGSGVSAALGLIFSVIPSVLLSPFAGTLGDLFAEKYLLAFVDFIRGLVVLLFISSRNVTAIYCLLVLLSTLDMFYSPSRKKIIVNVTGKNEILNANSLLTGISGAAFLAGPILAGILTDLCGLGAAFIINSMTSLSSALLILSIRTVPMKMAVWTGKFQKRKRLIEEVVKGYNYYKNNRPIKEIVMTCMIAGFSMISVNMAFYPFAFDVLNVTAKGWSLMLSIYYGTNLLAMFLMGFLPIKTEGSVWRLIYGGLAATAVIWFFYGLVGSLFTVLVLQFIEGTVLAICGILLTTQLQTLALKGFMARVAGISDIVTSIGKVAGMACAYSVILLESCRSVFFINSLVLLSFALFKLIMVPHRQVNVHQ